MYIGFKTSFYAVRHLDSIASYLPTGLHLGFFRSQPSLHLPPSFSSVFLVLSFVSASTSMLFWIIFLLPFFEHGRTMSVFSSLCLGFFSMCVLFPGDGVLAHRPNPQPGGPMYLSLSGCSPLTCPAREALPVATLPPASLSRSLHQASLLTRQTEMFS